VLTRAVAAIRLRHDGGRHGQEGRSSRFTLTDAVGPKEKTAEPGKGLAVLWANKKLTGGGGYTTAAFSCESTTSCLTLSIKVQILGA
jgi:hypothetical protein